MNTFIRVSVAIMGFMLLVLAAAMVVMEAHTGELLPIPPITVSLMGLAMLIGHRLIATR